LAHKLSRAFRFDLREMPEIKPWERTLLKKLLEYVSYELLPKSHFRLRARDLPREVLGE